MTDEHLNQFHKPADEGGGPWGPPGYDKSHGDCWATEGAQAGRWATDGAWNVGPPGIRKLSGNPRLGGLPRDVATALRKHGLTVHCPRGGVSWRTVVARSAAGWFTVIATDYDLIPDAKSCQPNFDGDHMLGLDPQDLTAAKVDYHDPLCEHEKAIDPQTIRAAARKVATAFGSPGLMVAFVKHEKAETPPADQTCEQKLAAAELEIADLEDRLAQIVAIATGKEITG